MPAIASVPPRSSAASAAGTMSPAGAKMIAESSGSGGASKVSPADAHAEPQGQPARLGGPGHDVDLAPSASATWAARCADAPKP